MPHPEYGQYHAMGWASRLNKKKEENLLSGSNNLPGITGYRHHMTSYLKLLLPHCPCNVILYPAITSQNDRFLP